MSLNDGYDDDDGDIEVRRCEFCDREYEDCECGERA